MLPLAGYLIGKQQALRIPDYRFAALLGLSTGMWSMVKSGKRGVGKKVIGCALRLWPEDRSEIARLAFLPAHGPRPVESVTRPRLARPRLRTRPVTRTPAHTP